jgi:hypothetical protein
VGSCTLNHLCTYGLNVPVRNVFDAGRSITSASGRVSGPGTSFLGQITLPYRLDAISQGSKNSRFPGLNPLPLALVIDLHASKTLHTGLYKS